MGGRGLDMGCSAGCLCRHSSRRGRLYSADEVEEVVHEPSGTGHAWTDTRGHLATYQRVNGHQN